MSTANRTSVWTRPERGARGPVPSLGRADITAAAIRIADAGGLAAVSMRAVAVALGTAAPSLYRYVESREDLLDLMVDAAVAELSPAEPTGAWLDDLVAVARLQLGNMRDHPWLPDALQRDLSYGPHTMDFFDRCLWMLEPVDCPTTSKLEAVGLMTGIVTLFARATAPQQPFMVAATPEQHPHLFAALAKAGDAAPRDPFAQAVRSVLTGLLTAASDSDGVG
ncbi:helix-turn-helix domain-containing protein [Catenulispora yoronensis]|uniref:TetR/AcrR family transcriptional regulator n=1 Tax=Catenulispora yoronensis TaxID=450799 RepID=UPI0031E0852E